MKKGHSAIGAAAIVAALTVAGCSSSSSSSAGGTGSASGGSPAAGGSAIKLLVISQLQAASFSFPEISSGAQAAADSINAAGGVNGHKIQVDTCNDQGNPNVAATCGRQAVQGGYAAVVNPVSLYSASFLPVLQAGNVPAIGGNPLTNPDFTNPVSFPSGGGNPLDYGGAGFVAAKSGCKTAGIIRDTAAAVDTTTTSLENGFVAGGGQPVKTVVKLAGTAPDFSGPVSQIVSSGVQCLLIGEQPQAVVKIVAGIRQSSKPDMVMATEAAAFPQALIESLGKAANGVLLTESVAIPSQKATPKFWADMTKYAPSADKTTQSLLAWIGVQTAKQVGGAANAYTNTDMLAAIQKAANVNNEGQAGPLNFSKPRSNPKYARIFAQYEWAYQVENGQYTPMFNGKPVDAASVLK